MKEKYNMGNETFQREKTSQNKYLRLKMLKYSIGRNFNEQQKKCSIFNAVALI